MRELGSLASPLVRLLARHPSLSALAVSARPDCRQLVYLVIWQLSYPEFATSPIHDTAPPSIIHSSRQFESVARYKNRTTVVMENIKEFAEYVRPSTPWEEESAIANVRAVCPPSSSR